MSLFDNIFGPDASDDRPLSGQEAFAGILVAATACNGHTSQEQLRGLSHITERMRLFDNVSSGKWNAMVDRLMKLHHREGSQQMVQRCAQTLPDGMRECAFANACDIVLADGTVDPEERAFLEHLHSTLALDNDTALNIVEVMIIKNRG